MKIHFIAIGGSAMHNLAIALYKKGYEITGSDDEIFEPSKSRLLKYNLLPAKNGWDITKIHKGLDAVILGMHAREDNPELLKAMQLNIKIYSYPEYIFEQSKNKTRIVIGGSHGKTTITSMVMHVLQTQNQSFDYMVGAQLEGFETMVKLSEAPLIILEGDEYLSSSIDKRPKFHHYLPHIASISGIAWDHINVFPTFKKYKKQFEIFTSKIVDNGHLIYFKGDKNIKKIVKKLKRNINKLPYSAHYFEQDDRNSYLLYKNKRIAVNFFGEHNMQNCNAAKLICNKIGISDEKFYESITTFKGAAKRLELVVKNATSHVFFDFAHAPSKVEATIKAVKKQFPNQKLIACLELHTFSSLNKNFLPHYTNTMELADIAYIYFNPKTLEHKKLKPISKKRIEKSFLHKNIKIFTTISDLTESLQEIDYQDSNILMMSSGNFSNLNFKNLFKKI